MTYVVERGRSYDTATPRVGHKIELVDMSPRDREFYSMTKGKIYEVTKVIDNPSPMVHTSVVVINDKGRPVGGLRPGRFNGPQ